MAKVRSKLIIYALVLSLSFGAVSAAYYKPVEVKASITLGALGSALLLAALATCGYYVTKTTYKNLSTDLEEWWLSSGASVLDSINLFGVSEETIQEMVDAALEAEEEAITSAIQSAVMAVIMYEMYGYEIPDDLGVTLTSDGVYTYTCSNGYVYIDAGAIVAGLDMALSGFKIPVTVVTPERSWQFDYAFAVLFITTIREFVDDCISKVGEYVAAMGTDTAIYKSSVMNHKKSKVDDVYTQIYEDIISTLQFSLVQQDFGDTSVVPGLYLKYMLANFRNITAEELQEAMEAYGCDVTQQLTMGIGYYSKTNLMYIFLGFIPDDYDYLIMDGSGVGIYKDGVRKHKSFDICLFSSNYAGTYTFEVMDAENINYARYAAYCGLLSDGAYKYSNNAYGKMYLLGVPEDKVYTSSPNYADGVTWEDELSGRVVYGPGIPADIDVNIPAIAPDTYYEITKPLDDVGTDDGAAAQVVVDVVIPDYTGEIEEATGAITGAIDDSSNKVVDAIDKQTKSMFGWVQDIIDAIKSIPGAIADFFTIDTAKLTEHTQRISGLWEYKFGAIYEISALFKDLSVEDDRTLPRLTITLPEQYGGVEVPLLDLTMWSEQLEWLRGLLEAGLWLLFGMYCLSLIKVNFNMT